MERERPPTGVKGVKEQVYLVVLGFFIRYVRVFSLIPFGRFLSPFSISEIAILSIGSAKQGKNTTSVIVNYIIFLGKTLAGYFSSSLTFPIHRIIIYFSVLFIAS